MKGKGKKQRRKNRIAERKQQKTRRSAMHTEGRLKPWVAPKMKLFQVPDLFKADVPREKRLEVLREIGKKSRAKFQELYPQTAKWVTEYDPVYVLAMCAVYFVSYPEGTDPEATGKRDFYHHYIELLQALALRGPRNVSPRPLLGEMGALKRHLQDLGDHISFRLFDVPSHLQTEEEIDAYGLRTGMMLQTTAVRNWAYPHQLERVQSDLSRRVAPAFQDLYGVDPERFFAMLYQLAAECEDKLNVHIGKIRRFSQARGYREIIAAYNTAFPENLPIDGEGVELIWDHAGKKARNLLSMLIAHADLKLNEIYTFDINHAHELMGLGADNAALGDLLELIAYRFGDLALSNPEHFILTNPVLTRPLINLGHGQYFSAVWGVLPHVALDILEDLVWRDEDLKKTYTEVKAQYVEDELERIVRDGFPNGKVLRGSLWKDPLGVEFENDVLVIIDTFAVVFEAKSASISDPARRGAPERLAKTLRELIEAPSEQALRFVDFLASNPPVHYLKTRRGEINIIDSGAIKHYIPIGVTLSHLGFIGANLKKLIASGIVTKKLEELAPSINITDLEAVFELLPREIEKIHYLVRRREFEAHMEYEADELDLLGFYLDNGFNIGNAEYDQQAALHIGLKSKELDPYFVGSRAGKTITKPRLAMTPWWDAILSMVSETRVHGWLETGFILLNTTEEDQKKFESNFKRLVRQILEGRTDKEHNWIHWSCGPERRRYVIIGYPYTTQDRTIRDSVLAEAMADQRVGRVRGAAAIGVNVLAPHFPYDVLARRASTDLFDTLTLTAKRGDQKKGDVAN